MPSRSWTPPMTSGDKHSVPFLRTTRGWRRACAQQALRRQRRGRLDLHRGVGVDEVRDAEKRHGGIVPPHPLAPDGIEQPRLARYASMSVTYTVMRTMCSAVPPAARRRPASYRGRPRTGSRTRGRRPPAVFAAVWPATNSRPKPGGTNRPWLKPRGEPSAAGLISSKTFVVSVRIATRVPDRPSGRKRVRCPSVQKHARGRGRTPSKCLDLILPSLGRNSTIALVAGAK